MRSNERNNRRYEPNHYYSSLHNTQQMRDFTEDLWLKGTSVHVMEKMLFSRIKRYMEKK
jgi:hypothetical protein